MDKHQGSRWGSRLGFILTTAGAAVGLGNIQRFPYITAECGGAAFVCIYLFCVLFVSLPLMLNELALGRHTHQNAISAIPSIRKKSPWALAGVLGVLTAFFILCYYSVAAGWTLGYAFSILRGSPPPYEEFAAEAGSVLFYTSLMLLATVYIVKKGVKRGLEFWSKILMPLMLLLLIILAVRSLTLPGSVQGLYFYLYPDFSEVQPKVFIYALSQAFFSLCIGEAVLITYGSYSPKKEDLVTSACYIAGFDTLVAILAGIVIFPALFSFGEPSSQGVGLIFNIMPKVFLGMAFGRLLGFFFFIILTFAALTTCIALMEMPVAFLTQSRGWKRGRAAWLVGLIALMLSIPSALSKGSSELFSSLSFMGQRGVYDIMDFVWGGLSMALGGLLLALFTGWVWGVDQAASELREGSCRFTWQAKPWCFIVKYFAPLAISIILISLFLI